MRHALATVLILIATPRVNAQTPSVPAEAQREVSALLDSAEAVGRRQDTAVFRRLVSPDFRFIHSTGRVNSISDFLGFLRNIVPDTMRSLSPDEFIASGNAVVVLKHGATRVPGRGWAEFRSTDVVVPAPASGWRWAMHQSTALPVTLTEWIDVPDSLLNAYAGEYVNATGFVRSVRRDGNRLMITAVGGTLLAYRAVTSSTFHAERGDAYAVFGRDDRGRVAYVEILQPSGGERFTRREESQSPAQQSTANPVGTWRGTSLCLVRPSACNDEVVVYRITRTTTTDSLTIDARKIVNGQEEEMGVLGCRFTRQSGVLACPVPQAVWRFTVRSDSLTGELRLKDNTKFRDVRTSRAP